MKKYLGQPLFCLRTDFGTKDIDCGIFTDKNIGGYGIGYRGNYFDENDFIRAISKRGDLLGRKLYTMGEIPLLLKELNIKNISELKSLIEKTRNSYSSTDPDLERSMSLYVELDSF